MFKNFTLLFLAICHYAYLPAQGISNNSPRLILNKAGHSSFAPFRYGDKIYFSSNFQEKNSTNNVTRLFSKKMSGWEFQLLEINPTKPGTHASNLTMTPNGKTVYYSICQDGTQEKCTIWLRNKQYDGEWEAASKLPDHINLRGHTSTQPSIGYDQTQNKNVLYFVSDRPFGKGGMDTWQSVIELDGSFGKAVPLPFNSSGDDVTPFFQQSKQTLFFSSNGMGGKGGFDVFSSQKMDNGQWNEPTNQGALVNGPFSETYFAYHAGQQKAYFASDRPIGTTGKKGITCIYELEPKVELSIAVFNNHNMAQLHSTTAHVYDETVGKKIIYREQPFDPNLKIVLSPERDYKVVVLKEGFMPSVLEFSTAGIIFPTAMKKEVYLFKEDAFNHKHRENYHSKQAFKQSFKEKAVKVNTEGRRASTVIKN